MYTPVYIYFYMIVNLLRNLPDFYCGESITSSDHIVLNDMY